MEIHASCGDAAVVPPSEHYPLPKKPKEEVEIDIVTL